MRCANSCLGGSRGGATAILLATLASDIPWAVGGIKRALEFRFRPGSLNCAEYPAGVSAGSVSGVYMTVNATIVAMAKMLSSSEKWRSKVISGSEGSWAVMYFSGIDQYGSPAVNIVMDALAAGIGARSFKDGDDTGGSSSRRSGSSPTSSTTSGTTPSSTSTGGRRPTRAVRGAGAVGAAARSG